MTSIDSHRPGFLSAETFTAAVAALPLISMDLCVTDPAGRLLLGLRVNAPAQGYWFTPGGRIRKGEAMGDAFVRLMREELALEGVGFDRARLMGAWDHFYDDSAYSASVTTHYVNLPHWIALTDDEAARVSAQEQHEQWRWRGVTDAAADASVHRYAQAYAEWLAGQGDAAR